MVHFCCVAGCSHRGHRQKCSFFRIPKVLTEYSCTHQELSKLRRLKFINAIQRKEWEPNANTRICSCHFLNGTPAKLADTLNPYWVPTLNMGYTTKIGNSKRCDRSKTRQLQKENNIKQLEILECSNHEFVEECDNLEIVLETGISCQTELTMMDIEAQEMKIRQLEDKIQQQREETESEIILAVAEGKYSCNANIREMEPKSEPIQKEDALLQVFSEELMKDSPDMLYFYTGIHEWTLFESIFELAEPFLHDGRKLTKFQKLMMFFMKIRLGLLDQDIAYRFQVHRASVGKIFHKVLHIMYCVTKKFISWPTRDILRSTMPLCFKVHFKKCAVIIDCTEIFIERPKNFEARGQVWSNYKSNSTLKCLIGVTPQGTISFVSEAWGGRASDKEITEESKLLEYLLPGDVILADRGFTINEYAGLVCAEVKVPAFKRGKPQLEERDVDWTRELAKVRIHIERVIGLVKNKFLILKNTIPIAFLHKTAEEQTTLDKLMHVCCALVNLCGPIVPLE